MSLYLPVDPVEFSAMNMPHHDWLSINDFLVQLSVIMSPTLHWPLETFNKMDKQNLEKLPAIPGMSLTIDGGSNNEVSCLNILKTSLTFALNIS